MLTSILFPLSAASATLSDRGIAAIGVELNWGVTGSIFEVTSGYFQKNSLKIFGYSYDHESLKGLRDLFANINTLLCYRLNGGGVKASNTFATAKYASTRGNDLKIVIAKNADDNTKWDVSTVLGSTIMDVQTVADATGLVSNDWVDFDSTATLLCNSGNCTCGWNKQCC